MIEWREEKKNENRSRTLMKCAENPILFVIDRAIKPIIRNEIESENKLVKLAATQKSVT